MNCLLSKHRQAIIAETASLRKRTGLMRRCCGKMARAEKKKPAGFLQRA
jgi:hypothetical protein